MESLPSRTIRRRTFPFTPKRSAPEPSSPSSPSSSLKTSARKRAVPAFSLSPLHLPAPSPQLREAFCDHLQNWANSPNRSPQDFRGWVCLSGDNRTYELGKPIKCLIRLEESRQVIKSVLKLYWRVTRPRRKSRLFACTTLSESASEELIPVSETGRYVAVMRIASGWAPEEDWTKMLAGKSSNPKDEVEEVDVDQWIFVGKPFPLMDLPKEMRLLIYQHALIKPNKFFFNDWRVDKKGGYHCDYFEGGDQFMKLSLVSFDVREELHSWFYSTTLFIFNSVPSFSQFLSNLTRPAFENLRRIQISFTEKDYYNLLTPEQLLCELELTIPDLERAVIRSKLPQLRLESLVIRVNQRPSHRTLIIGTIGARSPDPVIQLTPCKDAPSIIDVGWIVKSIERFFKNVPYVSRVRVEDSSWPHRPIEAIQEFDLSWDAYIDAATDPYLVSPKVRQGPPSAEGMGGRFDIGTILGRWMLSKEACFCPTLCTLGRHGPRNS
ncbi:hypothetical protein P152DRAFT_5778 [Eremomyces bilateralis CBS 781.70]|uniref:Uncharacterized protein n=1 Tax=Eremomyces bilateralis CBS 781.70 TaxID=1392243 RepID=A0A6G1GG21_9PEZI|nr:uncharacterized protein P152DRAFT_5778 [Eremomyces bilateralis CBS 781.70]KAF1817003.1 hypothetical protein P152DRAFT_5778 [Eremomyces bilateralis CBS 781.70]